MRPIKFRGKRIDNGEWAYGNHYGTGQESLELFFMAVAAGFIDLKTVEQFVCLDKNGKEVFAGDNNIRHDLYPDQLATMVWSKQDLKWKLFFPWTHHKTYIRLDKQLERAENIELIGEQESEVNDG